MGDSMTAQRKLAGCVCNCVFEMLSAPRCGYATALIMTRI